MPYILVFILPLPFDIEFLSFLVFVRLLPSGAPLVKTSPGPTLPLGSLAIGAVPLGTALGAAVLLALRGAEAGVVWAAAALKLHKPAARRKCESFMLERKINGTLCTPKAVAGLCAALATRRGA